MMIMKMFPKKLLSRIKQYAQSFKILSAFELIKIHLQFCSQRVAAFPVTGSVVLLVNDMISSFAFQPRRAVGASVLDQQQSVGDMNFNSVEFYLCRLNVNSQGFNLKDIAIQLFVLNFWSILPEDWISQKTYLVYKLIVKVHRDNMTVYFICVLKKYHNYFGRNMLYYWFYYSFLLRFANKSFLLTRK